MADTQRTALGPVGEALMHNIKRIRESQKLTYVELSKRLGEVGRPTPVLGLRRIERGERRIDVDDLLALAYALKVHPVDLLVPADAPDDQPYDITTEATATAGTVRGWIGGYGFLEPVESLAEMADAIRFMPKSRGEEVMRQWWTPQREAEQNRQINRMEAEHGPGLYGPGGFTPTPPETPEGDG